ncbi:MAG: hypothetical protein ACRBBW_08885 [Cellvibrionaceae bacterium]
MPRSFDSALDFAEQYFACLFRPKSAQAIIPQRLYRSSFFGQDLSRIETSIPRFSFAIV